MSTWSAEGRKNVVTGHPFVSTIRFTSALRMPQPTNKTGSIFDQPE